MNNSVLSLIPGFTSEAQQLFNTLSGVTVVLAFAGLTIQTIQALRDRAAVSIFPTLIRLMICVILLGSIASWGNMLASTVNDVVTQLGLGTTSGGVFTAYQKAIAQKWGSNSAPAGSFESGGSNGQSAGTTGTFGAAPLPTGVATGTKVTAYGFSTDLTGDSNSAAGIGNHNNQLVAYGTPGFTSAALTESAAQQYGVTLGQNFTVPGANGQVYQLNYADTVPSTFNGASTGNRIDIFDPNQLLTGGDDNNFLTTANGVSLGDIPANGIGNVIGSGISKIGDSLNIMLLWPLTHMLSLIALGIMWLMQAVQEILFQVEIAVAPIFIGMFMIPRLIGTATKFFASLVSITAWGIGWAICDLLTTALINLAVNPTNNVAVTAASPLTAIGIWITLAIWVLGSSLIAPLIVSAMLMQGSSGLAAVFGATVGSASSRLLMSPVIGAASTAAGSSVSAVSSQSSAMINGMRPSVSRRPPAEEVKPL
jgi:hypothetical protein